MFEAKTMKKTEPVIKIFFTSQKTLLEDRS
ncbi:hypothetical protein V512_008340 [Mesotoga sp. Brook.08.105.5.1]|nr:hypothetical protein V512_008340 [Mesotoga sp. Brook.08.105.5.1]RAO97367.1 hypothetical protein M388_00945 [Mesotoga sp. Brook.08.YT.4.2.5.4.]